MNKPLIAITTSICSIVTTIAIMSMTGVVSAQSNNYDVNQDGKISIMDIIALKQFILGCDVPDNIKQDLVTVTFEDIKLCPGQTGQTIGVGATIINKTDTNLVMQPICTIVTNSTGKTYIGAVDTHMGTPQGPLDPCSISQTIVVIWSPIDIDDIHTIEMEFMCYDKDTAEFVTHIEPVTLYVNKEAAYADN